MAKKAASAGDMALQALSELLADPAPRVLFDAKQGVFRGTKAKFGPAAQIALDSGWLAPTGHQIEMGTAKKKQRVDTYCLTASGVAACVDRGEARDHIARLQVAFETLAAGLQAEREAARQRQAADIAAIQAACDHLAKQVREIVAASRENGPSTTSLEVASQALARLAEAAKPLDIDALAAKMAESRSRNATEPAEAANPSPSGPQAALHLASEVLALVEAQKRRDSFQLLTLPQVLASLKRNHPTLTLGQFHEEMRRLHNSHKIFLVPFTDALALLDDAENALYLDNEVKFYVDLPQR